MNRERVQRLFSAGHVFRILRTLACILVFDGLGMDPSLVHADAASECEVETGLWPDAIATAGCRIGCETALVFVDYLSAPGCDGRGPQATTLPAWADKLAIDYEGFLDFASNGNLRSSVRVLKRPDPTAEVNRGFLDTAWQAPRPSCDYVAAGGMGGMAGDVLAIIKREYSQAWGTLPLSTIDYLILISYECVSSNACAPGPRGAAPIVIYPGSPNSGFSGTIAFTMFRAEGGEWPGVVTPPRIEAIVQHEHQHLILADHVAGSDGPAGSGCGQLPTKSSWTNYGHYSGFAGKGPNETNGPLPPDEGFLPYHPEELERLGWLRQISFGPVVSGQTIRIPPFRDRGAPYNAVNLWVAPPEGGYKGERFVLVNYQPQDRPGDFDRKYGGAGLLIWHARGVWRLESPVGRIHPPRGHGSMIDTPMKADPMTWLSPMEADPCHRGSAEDFWGPGTPLAKTQFSCATNPNTNRFSNEFTTQAVSTGLSFENIRYEPGSRAILLEVTSIARQQDLVSPDGGEFVARGEVLDIVWSGALHCASFVDLYISDRLGGNFKSIAMNLENRGLFEHAFNAVQPLGTAYRVKLDSHDGTGKVFKTDQSTRGFTVWDITSAAVPSILAQDCNLTFEFAWTTSVATNGDDTIELIRPGETVPETFLGTGTGTAHSHVVQLPCEPGLWQYRVGSTTCSPEPCPSTRSSRAGTAFQSVSIGPDRCSLEACPGTDAAPHARDGHILPTAPGLSNLPNPFNPSTRVRFAVTIPGSVRVAVFDIAGRWICDLTRGDYAVGPHHVDWDGTDAQGRPVPSGIYHCQAMIGAETFSRKMVLAR